MDEAASAWQLVTRAAPQGSVPGTDLFNMLISNLDAGVECSINKSAVSNKLECVIDSLEGREALQRALDRFKNWTSLMV